MQQCEAIKILQDVRFESTGRMRKCDIDRVFNAINMAISALEVNELCLGWTPVSEGLPATDDRVLYGHQERK